MILFPAVMSYDYPEKQKINMRNMLTIKQAIVVIMYQVMIPVMLVMLLCNYETCFFEDITGGVSAPPEKFSIDSGKPVDGGCIAPTVNGAGPRELQLRGQAPGNYNYETCHCCSVKMQTNYMVL
jgi:hypothetical protein